MPRVSQASLVVVAVLPAAGACMYASERHEPTPAPAITGRYSGLGGGGSAPA
ncbi:MAG: hypothetical protein OXG37_11415 [Actinomycetia bacterium]|nr:hypothetical protein [Actinomycetes bacterium]